MKNLRPVLASTLALLCAGAAPYEAAAQAVVRSAPLRAPVAPAPFAGVGLRSANLGAPGLSTPLLPAPGLSASQTPSVALPRAAVSAAVGAAVVQPAMVQAAAAQAVLPAVQAAAVPDLALIGNFSAPTAAEFAGSRGALEALGGSLSQAKSGRGSLSRSLDLAFDGGAVRRAAGDVFAGAPTARAAGLASHGPAARVGVTEPAAPKSETPAPKNTLARTGLIAAVSMLAVVGALFAAPTVAIASAGGVSVMAMAYVHPFGAVAAAAVGAIYGLVVARKPDGSAPGTADVLASVIRHAIIAGAGTYVAFDLAAVYLMGMPPMALSPLPLTLGTAAMAQGAFQGKFADPATSSADRVLGAFPAVAAALGLNIMPFLVSPGLLLTAAIGAMSVTGAAAAVYAAVYQPGKSSDAGPAAMARGFVLQGLMSGIALSVSSPYLAAPFLALAAWGFWDVMSTTLMALAARLPEPVRKALRLK